jgi:hypothetical protein
MLNSLIERVNSTQLSEKDMDAEALLARGFSQNPDAVYILAQSVLVQNIALEQAKMQLNAAQQQVAQLQQHPAHATSFLGRLLGDKDPQPAPPAQAGYQPVYSPQPTEYQQPYQGQPYQGQPYQGQPYQGQPYPPQGYGAPGYVGVPQGQPSFLRSAAQTAAGVAAGALVFEGVESMLHGGFGHPGMGMGMGGGGMPGVGMGMGYERPIEENVVNNYYDSPGGERHEGGEHQFGNDSGSGQLADDSWSEPGNDDGGGGSGFDDSSSFDDGGGGSNDDSGGF